MDKEVKLPTQENTCPNCGNKFFAEGGDLQCGKCGHNFHNEVITATITRKTRGFRIK